MAKNIKKRMPNFYFKVSIWVKSDQGPSPGSLEWLLSEAEATGGLVIGLFPTGIPAFCQSSPSRWVGMSQKLALTFQRRQ